MTNASHELAEVLARAPDELVVAAVRQRLIALAERCCSEPDMAILEFRVSEDFDEQVDLSTALVSGRARRDFAERAAALASHGDRDWRTIARLAEDWQRGACRQLRRVSGAYLEFDVAGERAELPVPSLFLRTTPLVRPHERPQTIAALMELAGSASAESCDLFPALREVLNALPENFHLAYLGLMLPRAHERVRLCLTLPAPEVAGFLRRIGAPIDVGPWLARLRWTERAGWLDVAVGLGSRGIEGRIGIEACARGGSAPMTSAALIDELARLGLCTPDRRRRLLSVVERGGEPNAPFELSHVKVALQAAAPPAAKAYLCARIGAGARGLSAVQRMPGMSRASQASGRRMPSDSKSSRL